MKHIDKVFRDKLYNQKATVPDGMWDKIAPALEEKSGRSILWFWFAGISTLLIGGIAYLLLSNYQDANSSSSAPLAIDVPMQESKPLAEISQTMAFADEASKKISDNQPVIQKAKKVKTIIDSPKPKKNKSTQKKTVTKSQSKKLISNNNLINTNNDVAVSSTEIINTDNLNAKPANLVITKSYISDNGSIIKKSDSSTGNDKSEPSYNVFINSEGLNAGALLRIIEPLENIPLPAFSSGLKKKIMH